MSEYYFVSNLNNYVISASEPKELGLILMKPYDASLQTQKWIVTSEGYIQLSGTELIMDIDQQNKNKGAKIVLWKKRNRDNQKWNFTPNGEIQSALNSFVFDIDQQGTKDSIIMWPTTSQSNQKFEFVPVKNFAQMYPNLVSTQSSQQYSQYTQQQQQSQYTQQQQQYTQQQSQYTQQQQQSQYTQQQSQYTEQQFSPFVNENAPTTKQVTYQSHYDEKPLLDFEIKSFLCPLTGKRMKEPVILVDSGRTYEKEAIALYSLHNDRDPITGVELKTKLFIPNYALQSAMSEIYKDL